MSVDPDTVLLNNDDVVITKHVYFCSNSSTLIFHVYYRKSSPEAFFEAIPFAKVLGYKDPLDAIIKHVKNDNIFTMPMLNDVKLNSVITDVRALFVTECGILELIHNLSVKTKVVEMLQEVIKKSVDHIHATRYNYLLEKNIKIVRNNRDLESSIEMLNKHINYYEEVFQDKLNAVIALKTDEITLLKNMCDELSAMKIESDKSTSKSVKIDKNAHPSNEHKP